MLRTFFLALIPAVALASAPKQVSMPVGHTTTISMPAAVSSVKVEDPALVQVTKDGRKVSMVGLSKGTTEVVVTTADGETHFLVYVAADRYSMP